MFGMRIVKISWRNRRIVGKSKEKEDLKIIFRFLGFSYLRKESRYYSIWGLIDD